MAITESRPLAERSPYLSGTYEPIHDEITATDLEVEGELPHDLFGVFTRNGANPRFEPPGRYHWFDGDGMVHGVHIEGGRAAYRNRFVRTEGLAEDEAAGEALTGGILERANLGRKGGPFKDTGNTDLVWFRNQLLALWWLSGKAHVLTVPELETQGITDFGGTLPCNMAAHAKVDPATGELLFIDYSPLPPYLRFGTIGADGALSHLVDIDLPGPRLQHDLAFTPQYAVLFDFSMMWDPELLLQGKARVTFRRDSPTRIGLVPRAGGNDDVRWFDVEPCFMYHVINAWEEGDEVVLVGCRIADPLMGDPANADPGRPVPNLAHLRLAPNLYEWRFDTVTGTAKERTLDDAFTEFPRMDDRSLGRPSRYSYSPKVAPLDVLQFDGFEVYDVTTGDVVDRHRYEDGWFGGEVSFAPKAGTHDDSVAADDRDGYLCTLAADSRTGTSELHVFDAADVARPIARVKIPQRVPTGYHSRWVPGEEITR